jgi:predicted ATP-dependent endonuclease of OLD family
MRIKFVEVQNFRKLKSIRIDLSDRTTLLVGANNSGKTSAMLALGHFLVDRRRFTTNDFTLSHWSAINAIGIAWEAQAAVVDAPAPTVTDWEAVLPSLDLWLDVGKNEIHHVSHLLPTLDWTAGPLGVRLRFEPKKVEELFKEYLVAIKAASETKQAGAKAKTEGDEHKVTLWPQNMRDFLERKLRMHFAVRAYLLDPTKCMTPVKGIAQPQALPSDSEPLASKARDGEVTEGEMLENESRDVDPLDGDPLAGLIRIDEISAQRGLGNPGNTASDPTDDRAPRTKRLLTEQLRSYYSNHLDPFEHPDPADLDALEAIENAQSAFDNRLEFGFSAALAELATLNYPGVTDPVLKIATRMRPTDGLNHSAAVQYEVTADTDGESGRAMRLPEEYNGLGYQNLISMVFKLMSYRDAWMRVGKASKTIPVAPKKKHFPPLLHLVLVEEPEAHLHVQVQQVFVRKAYDVLRNHKDLGESTALTTQLIVSTHSGHVAHETAYSCLRYFRRLPAQGKGQIPTTAVINLSNVFGDNDETDKFVTRYLRTTHCDLFFADATILVEGPAERILIPHFIREHYPELSCCFVTLLEVGGSHAHRLKPLIEHLGLTTLIVTDIDSVDSSSHHKAVPPKRNDNQLTGNDTLKKWHPELSSLDQLLDHPDKDKVRHSDIPLFSVRVAYQKPLQVSLSAGADPVEILATTFEDALVLENIALFSNLECSGMALAFKKTLAKPLAADALGAALFDVVRKGDKAAFALDMLLLKDPKELKVPAYISDGLGWLESQLDRKKKVAAACDTTALSLGAAS